MAAGARVLWAYLPVSYETAKMPCEHPKVLCEVAKVPCEYGQVLGQLPPIPPRRQTQVQLLVAHTPEMSLRALGKANF